jgi:hypothetical protein
LAGEDRRSVGRRVRSAPALFKGALAETFANQRIRTFIAGGLIALALAGPVDATPPDTQIEIQHSPEERLDGIDTGSRCDRKK